MEVIIEQPIKVQFFGSFFKQTDVHEINIFYWL
jgi:hypothetical protein